MVLNVDIFLLADNTIQRRLGAVYAIILGQVSAEVKAGVCIRFPFLAGCSPPLVFPRNICIHAKERSGMNSYPVYSQLSRKIQLTEKRTQLYVNWLGRQEREEA